MPELPTGTVTFLFTDIEGSTSQWQQSPDAMEQAVARHDWLLRGVVHDNGGHIFSTGGDGIAAAFQTARSGVRAAVEAQRRFADEKWPSGVSIRVRMGLHTGEARERDGDYFGTTLNRAARLMAIGHGEQILVSGTTEALLHDGLASDGIALADLGAHRLRDLAEPIQVFQVEHPAIAREFPPLRSLDAYPGNLPLQVSSFVGREREVHDIAKELETVRLITLTGVGGVGKTRLALQVAAELLVSFRDGAWLVELAGVVSDEGVQEAIASAIGFVGGLAAAGAGPLEYLRTKELLLVLDNCEHLLGAVATFVNQVLRGAPAVRVLATSREGLGVAGEHLRAVPSLDLPHELDPPEVIGSADAMRLFAERAREVSTDFELGPDQAGAVAELCRRLDGIPLAIELAAARVPALTPAEIAAHLDRRFRLLTGGRRSAVSRHQTLHNAIQWSYELLDVGEQSVFDRLAVFAGGFDLDAAQAVATTEYVDPLDVLDVLTRLVAKSLVVAEPRGGTTRYRLLETVRDFGWERLQAAGTADDISRRHAEYFARFARDAGQGLQGPREIDWRPRVEREVDNLRAATAWAIAHDNAELALRPIADLAILGDRLAPYGLLAESAARVDLHHPLAPVALGAASFAAELLGVLDDGLRLGREALERVAALDRSPEGLWIRCRAYNAACTAYALMEGIQDFADLWLADARDLDDPWCLCEALTFRIGLVEIDDAISAGEEALVLAHELGSPSRTAFAAQFLAARMAEVDPSRVGPLLEEARRAGDLAENDWVDYTSSVAELMLHLSTGDTTAAADAAVRAAERSLRQRISGHVVQFVAQFSCLAAILGDEEGALVTALWVEVRGFSVINSSHPMWMSLGQEALQALHARTPPTEWERLARLAADFDDSRVVRFARDRLALLKDNSQ